MRENVSKTKSMKCNKCKLYIPSHDRMKIHLVFKEINKILPQIIIIIMIIIIINANCYSALSKSTKALYNQGKKVKSTN